MEKEDSGMGVVAGRAEIDARQPFKSVKEAVMLFGERVLVGEIYGSRLREAQAAAAAAAAGCKNETYQSRVGALRQELEETKESLQRAREEINLMSKCIQSIKEELDETKKELKQLKARDYGKQPAAVHEDHPEIEELKFDETAACRIEKGKRYVKFASPPSKVLAHQQMFVRKEEMVERKASAKKNMKIIKRSIPLMGWLFSSKKGVGQEADSLIVS